jgi:hypothetical protein
MISTGETTTVNIQKTFKAVSGITFIGDATTVVVSDGGSSVLYKLNVQTGAVSHLSGIERVCSTSNVGYVFCNPDARFADGTGSQAIFYSPSGLAYEAGTGSVLVCDEENHVLRRVNLTDGSTSTVAGNTASGYAEGTKDTAAFRRPSSVVITPDGTSAVVADTYNNCIRLVNLKTGQTSLLVGTELSDVERLALVTSSSGSGTTLPPGSFPSGSGATDPSSGSGVPSGSGTGGTGGSTFPSGSGATDPSGGSGVPSGSGTGGTGGSTFPSGSGATDPSGGSGVPSGSGTGGTGGSTFPSGSGATDPSGGSGVPSGSGTFPSGSGGFGQSGGTGSTTDPTDACAGRPDSDGFRFPGFVTMPTGGEFFSEPYTFSPTTLALPTGLALSADGKVLYTADRLNNRVRSYHMETQELKTIAGPGFQDAAPGTDGVGTAATFSQPTSIALGSEGWMFIVDSVSHRVRMLPSVPGTAYDTSLGFFHCPACPAGTVSKAAGSSQCEPCPESTYSQAGSETCSFCPDGSSTNRQIGNTNISACVCDMSLYRGTDSTGKVLCLKCPVGARCRDGTCALRNPHHTCVEDNVIRRISGTWILRDGEKRLIECPAGSLVVNASSDGQNCLQCLPGTFSFSSTDNCGKDSCVERECNQCPAGARCAGGSKFEPLIQGSVWEKVLEGNTIRMRLQACPPGHVLVRSPARPEADECVKCLPNTYMVQQASYVTGKGVSSSAALLQNGLELCLTCPAGSICDGQDEVISSNIQFTRD